MHRSSDIDACKAGLEIDHARPLVVASISAFAAIWALMQVLERFTVWPFVIYRAVLGAVLLIGVAKGWLAWYFSLR